MPLPYTYNDQHISQQWANLNQDLKNLHPRKPITPSEGATSAPNFSQAATNPGCIKFLTIVLNISWSLGAGYGSSGIGTPRKGQICSQPSPSSSLIIRVRSFGSLSLTVLILLVKVVSSYCCPGSKQLSSLR